MADEQQRNGGHDFECRVCHAYATGFHFRAQSCQACCAFFRRAVALNRRYLCHRRQTNGGAACAIKYTEKVLCRACRLEKCLAIGMDKNAVQLPKDSSSPSAPPGRPYFTVSGLRRNKRFASEALALIELRNGVDPPTASAADDQGSCAPSSVHSSPSSASKLSHPLPPPPPPSTASSSADAAAEQPPPLPQSHHHFLPPQSSPHLVLCPPPPPSMPLSSSLTKQSSSSKWDLFGLLIAEEMRIAERRRILFCERPVASLLGMAKSCPFSREDLRPLRFQEFRRSIRTHILLVYEWLRVWPGYGMLGIADQTTLLRKCVLYHTILDPCFLTIQIGDSSKFVMPNGGYVSTEKDDGWEDEAEISRETKMSIYWPFLLVVLRNVIGPMHSMQLEFDEFVALKAIVSFQMTLSDISPFGRSLISAEISSLCRSLHNHYGAKFKNPMECAERFGNLLLLLSPIFETANTFVESHHIVQFFDLWQMDSLMLQFLKNKS